MKTIFVENPWLKATRIGVLLVVHSAILFAPPISASADVVDSRPNIIMVFIDDMGWADFSCFGNEEAKTVQIDQLANEGIAFEQFYVNSPICSPSRVALSTGQYPQKWRINSYLNNRKSNEQRGIADWLDVKAPMLARSLQQSGYATGHFGKWHMGGQRNIHEAPLITEYGFDESITNFEGLGARVLPLKYSPGDKRPVQHNLGSDTLGHGPVIWHDRAYVTEKFTEAALAFARCAESQDQPFYLNLWPDDVHTPMHPPLQKWGDGANRTLYLAVLETMDRQLGVIFDYVRSNRKLRGNTVILVCSDNGPEVGFGSAAPLRGHKATLYEGGIRSSLVVWAPGLMPATAHGSRNRESVFSAIDLVPSLLSITGTAVPTGVQFDGEDLSATLLGKSQKARAAPLFFRRPPDRKNFRHYSSLPDLAVRSGPWKFYCGYEGDHPELYNLVDDVVEQNPVTSQNPSVVTELTKQLLTWHAALPPDNGPALGKLQR
ncbi:MAG: sulfatase-like hydrolase/transferase [Fuerstiella sp.]|nr:sulfatase-like hydrolase/transferase [Fuerstiella sp.]